MCTKYPFSCLVCLTPKEGSTRMGIIKRLVGPMTATACIGPPECDAEIWTRLGGC